MITWLVKSAGSSNYTGRELAARTLSCAALPLLLALTAGCQLLPVGGPPASTPTPEIVQLNIEVGPGGLDLPDPRVGLDELTSYKSTLTASFEGTQAGKAFQWTQAFAFLRTTETAAIQLSIESTGQAPDLIPSFMAETGGVAYQRSGEGECFATALDPENSLIQQFEPAAQLPGLWGAEEAGKESVNGVEATRYTFDERALGEAGLNTSAGEVWLASDGGLVLRYRRTTTADAGYFGNDTEGTLSWEYALTEINQPVTIAVPDDCPPGLVDVPRLPDANNVKDLPGALRYETATSVADARLFYQSELPKLGWELPAVMNMPPGVTAEEYQRALELLKGLGGGIAPTPTEDPNKAVDVFHQGGQSLFVLITSDGPKTKVLISLGSKEQ